MAVVSGELFASLADVVLVSRGKAAGWTSMRRFVPEARLVYLGEGAAIPPSAGVVFCCTDELVAAKGLLAASPSWRVLLLHNSDEAPNARVVTDLLKSKPAAVVYAQNVEFHHERVFALPIGVANSMWEHGDPRRWADAAATASLRAARGAGKAFSHFVTRDITLLRTHFEPTHPQRAALAAMTRPDLYAAGQVPPRDFPSLLLRSKYVICPRGNGVDTHRVWEALACGAVPVVLDGPWARALRRTLPHLPILVVKDAAALASMPLPSWDAQMAQERAQPGARAPLHVNYWQQRFVAHFLIE